MLVWLWTRNDETGLLDDEFKDNDVFKTEADSFEASIGTQEKKSWLIVKIPDPPNLQKVRDHLVRTEYQPGATPEAEHVVRNKRLYLSDWRQKFTITEIDTIEDPNQMLPDGPLLSGGTVTSGVVSGKFTITDLRRK